MTDTTIIWFTGLSGSGKSTITDIVTCALIRLGKKVRILDGDVVRSEINPHLGFSPADIRENNRIITDLCAQNIGKYDYIVVPVISPFADSRAATRQVLGKNLKLIYCRISLEKVIARDPKGLYKKALNNEIDNFIGISPDVPYDTPLDADLNIDTCGEDPETSAARVLALLGIE